MRILAIGAHPDDIEYGCGGTLIISKMKKYKIHLLVLTKGESGGDPKIRQKEQEKSAKFLKANLYWGNLIDTEVKLDKNLIDIIEYYSRKIKPDVIFTPYYNDTHQDHRNVSTATMTATRHFRNILFYEVPTTNDFMPNVFVDTRKVLPDKLKILKMHKSQVFKTRVSGLNILENVKSTAIFRGFQDRVKYAEGFLPLRLSLLYFEK
ncbi:MAG: PIG-L deacetylase family protein [Candidatus Firestonebacteria bacterium]